ncbi:hypothetical protein FG386_000645 [Cryptosporidium ryanae]|uniref:uncharacterized protein n=1 Tax=Cryptosporidium ryanae TaxID=515981 RepID=UPI00351A4CA9|nr:hypothetical protein FG386_000645 [Cryptosporidium ryanae]
MRLTPKMFICELPEKVRSDGDCCWLQGYITGVNLDDQKGMKYAIIDDGTLSTKVYVENCVGEVDEANKESEETNVRKESMKIYKNLLGELLCEGRYVSTVCELRNGVLNIIHISDSINDNPNSEIEWLNSIIKFRNEVIL